MLTALLLLACIGILYLFQLSAVGVLGPDEPRYAAIGHAMYQSGDYVTPTLWGSPWFEKPPLLYWMTAAGTALGLSAEAAGRAPVASLSLLFLGLMFYLLQREFGRTGALVACVTLGTSAGWLAYSSLCLTDVPVAVTFALAVFLCLPLLRSQPDTRRMPLRFAAIGACLGLGALAKGLVPFALAAPFFWYLRQYWRQWVFAFVACAAVSVPWYLLVYLRNGYPFIEELFIRHHFQRLYSASLQHGQPWYYYGPVLLAGLFPWTPVLFLLFLRRISFDARERFLLATAGFGLLFFSCSLNKLPGYLLPLLPPLLAAVGSRVAQAPAVLLDRRWLGACAVLIAVIPFVAELVPPSLSGGRFSTSALSGSHRYLVYSLIPIVALLFRQRALVAPFLAWMVIGGGMLVKGTDFPVLDREVSARGLWLRVKPVADQLCDAGANRDWIYGLSFYRGSFIGYCTAGEPGLGIRSTGHGQPDIAPLQ